MSKQITVSSFEELAQVFRSEPLAPDPAEGVEQPAVEPSEVDAPELATLIAELQRAGSTLAAIARKDDEVRRQALGELERYEALVAQQTEAEAVCRRARQVRRQAHELVDTAFETEAREAAEHVIQLAERAEAQAAQAAIGRREAIEQLASSIDLERLLAERRRLEETEHRRAAEAERVGRLSAALAGARSALQSGQLEP